MQPSFNGIGSSSRVRKTYSVAARQIECGALKLFCCCLLVPVKSTSAVRAARSTRIATETSAPLSIS